MDDKVLMKGNEAIAEAAVRAGCRFFAGYPITPQNELPEYMSARMPEVGGHFIQGESEIASIFMVYGVAATGIRSMTSSSGAGLALKAEGMSFLATARVPAVYVDVARGGPAMGTIQAAQQDYNAVKSPAAGGFKCFVLAPHTVQEAVDLTYKAFDIADTYRSPVVVYLDGLIGNMMEVVQFPPMRDLDTLPAHTDWKLTVYDEDKIRTVNSFMGTSDRCQASNIELYKLYQL